MAWPDRIKPAAYTSPSGTRLKFDYENVGKSIEKQGTAFTFPDADGTYVQSTGKTGNKYPLRAFFSGSNCDLEAEAFEALLLEAGAGKLEHPMYGTKTVVPFGPITRRDDLKDAANQVILQLVFWETIGVIYPTAAADPASVVLNAVEEQSAAAAAELETSIITDTVNALVTFGNAAQARVDQVQSGLQAVADVQENVKKQFDSIVSSINNGIDVLVRDPLTLGFQITQLIQAPARALTSIRARLDAYKNLAQSVISGDGAVAEPGTDPVAASNTFTTNDVFATGFVTGSIVSALNNQFFTKTEALEAAEEILGLFSDVATWRDDNFEALQKIDTGGSYQKLQEAVAITAGFLVEISFDLKQERRLVLQSPRGVIDLAGELYRNIDSELDFFITSNDLTGSEIMELPAGREVVYYT